jgi:hypothetical protein
MMDKQAMLERKIYLKGQLIEILKLEVQELKLELLEIKYGAEDKS